MADQIAEKVVARLNHEWERQRQWQRKSADQWEWESEIGVSAGQWELERWRRRA